MPSLPLNSIVPIRSSLARAVFVLPSVDLALFNCIFAPLAVGFEVPEYANIPTHLLVSSAAPTNCASCPPASAEEFKFDLYAVVPINNLPPVKYESPLDLKNLIS